MFMDLYVRVELTQNETLWAGSPVPHQMNQTFGMYDYMLLQSGSAEAKLLIPGVANKTMFFTQEYTFCVVREDSGMGVIVESVIDWHNDRRTFQDPTSPCPIMLGGQTSGNGTVGADGIITISYSSKDVDKGVDVRSYFGEWSFQLFLLAPSSTDTTSTLPEAASTSTPPQSSVGTSISVDASSPPAGYQSAVIGGAAGGAVLAIVVLVGVWFWCRKRKEEMEMKTIIAHGPLLPYEKTTLGQDRQGKSEPPQEENYTRRKNPELPVDIVDAPELSPRASSSTAQPAVISELLPHRRPPSTVFSAAPPAYDSHSNANQAISILSTEDEPGPFLVGDLLGDWAEENRDALPYHLETRLRGGGYVTGTHPNSISPEVWLSRFAVTRWELAGLVELFERTNGVPSRTPIITE